MLNRRQRGFSLLEVLLGSSGAISLLATGASVVAHLLGATASDLREVRHRQDINALELLMAREIRQAGSWFSPAISTGHNNPFTAASTDLQLIGEQCIVFSYDHDQNGKLHRREQGGFRLRDNAIEKRKNARRCDQSGWEKLTDPQRLQIQTLRMHVRSKTIDGLANRRLMYRQVTLDLSARSVRAPQREFIVQRLINVVNPRLTVRPAR